MEVALYDPEHGFFATGPLRSTKSGDFLTSPEVSSMFGETIAYAVVAEWRRLGQPNDFTVVEVGAGSGSLMEPLLETIPFDPVVSVVEASEAARSALAERIPTATVVRELADLPRSFTGVVIANELVDNLPMAIGVREGDAWTERLVDARDGELTLVSAPARPEVLAWLDAHAGPVPEGGVVEVQLAAASWVRSILTEHLAAGALITIDYGETAEVLEPRRAEGTIRTYRAHHLGPHPLDEPGATDITADVNFTALIAACRDAGATVEYHRQDDYLAAWGFRDRLSALRHEELALASGDDAMGRLRLRSLVQEAETLMHPRGLGDFRVLVARL